MSKHTPGPWQFVVENGERKIIADGQATMCDTRYYPWCPYNDADWRLIASAPDLLEACKAALSDDQPYIEKCRAAIAKATGEQA